MTLEEFTGFLNKIFYCPVKRPSFTEHQKKWLIFMIHEWDTLWENQKNIVNETYMRQSIRHLMELISGCDELVE